MTLDRYQKLMDLSEKKNKEIEQYKHTLEHHINEIKLLTAEIDQKDEETERLKKENATLSDECIRYTVKIERLKELLKKGLEMETFLQEQIWRAQVQQALKEQRDG